MCWRNFLKPLTRFFTGPHRSSLALVGILMWSMLSFPEEKTKVNERELQLLARLMYGENRQDMTQEEAAAIADTVVNRTQYEGFPDTVEGVLLQPRQFQPLSPRSAKASQVNASTVAEFGPGDPRWEEFATMAQYGLQDPALNNRQRAPFTHYFSGEVAPPWAKNLSNLTRIGRHTFGVEKRKKKAPKK